MMVNMKLFSHRIGLFLIFGLLCFSCQNSDEKTDDQGVERFERSDAAILKGVYVPSNADMFFTSGLVAPIKDADAASGSNQQYGTTYEQSIGALNKVKETLDLKGFSLENIVFLRVYLAPDSSGVIDFKSFFSAYDNYFKRYPNVPQIARATIGVHSLARAGLLVEVEAVAAK
ncbi:MAG: enamine deaminase RidA (YjgF/YER057c/UK114 family) [Marivirga sp.]|jgi:enamine deaminase RidA (YjgF/YER057c/UK114 family)